MAKKKKKSEAVNLTFANLPKEVLGKLLEYVDGHTIWKPEAIAACGVPAELVEQITDTEKSDKRQGPKGCLFGKDGELIPEVRGVYGLTLARRMASDLGLTVPSMMGRGFWAQALGSAIKKHIEGM